MNTVEMIFPWMLLAWAAVIVIAALALMLYRRRHRPDSSGSLPVAHSDRLTQLPAYRSALVRYRIIVSVLAAGGVLLLVASVLLTARFASVSFVQPDLKNRDIVLCLDISGSMIDYDEEVLNTFAELAEEFTGERISLVVFNASAVTYFPLTSDYDYITAQFEKLNADFGSDDGAYYRGTLVGNDQGSSLVGDGLASCALRFDDSTERSQSIILVTDNLIVGTPIFTLQQAGELARDRGIRVYGVNPGDTVAKDYLQEFAVEYREVIEATGGVYYPLEDPDAIPTIVRQITSEEAAFIEGPLQLQRNDQPALFVWLAGLGLIGLFIGAWRLRR